MEKNNLRKKLLDIALSILIIIVFLAAFRYFGNLLLPFVIGFIFATLIRSFVKFIEKATGMNSKISAGICTAVCFVVIFVLVFVAVRAVVGEVIRLADNLPELYENNISPIIKRAEQFFSSINKGDSGFEKMLLSFFANAENKALDFVTTLSGNAAEKLANLLIKIPDLFVTVTVTIVATFFISIDYDTINDYLMSRLENTTKSKLTIIKETLFDAVGKMCLSYLFIFLITFAELAAGLFLLRIKYALVISLIIAVADIFPVIGTGTILLPWAVIELVNGNKPLALGLFALFLIISVVRNIVEPKLIGKNSGIHPIATMAAMYVGLKIGGILCAIAFPFAIMILKELNDKRMIRLFNG